MEGPTETILWAIRRAGFNVGESEIIEPMTSRRAYHLNVIDAKTRESWTVQADDPYQAAVELAV